MQSNLKNTWKKNKDNQFHQYSKVQSLFWGSRQTVDVCKHPKESYAIPRCRGTEWTFWFWEGGMGRLSDMQWVKASLGTSRANCKSHSSTGRSIAWYDLQWVWTSQPHDPGVWRSPGSSPGPVLLHRGFLTGESSPQISNILLQFGSTFTAL